MKKWLHHFNQLPLLARFFTFAASMVVIFGVLVHLIEPTTFPTIFDGIWWAIVTTSTIGYGDFVPATFTGKFIAIILIVVGAGFVTTYFVTLSSATIARLQQKLNGGTSYMGKNHIVLVGWNERSKALISHYTKYKDNTQIVLIDNTAEENPFPHERITFIKGKPYNDETLQRANVASASQMVITANQHLDEADSDKEVVLTILSAKGIGENVYCIAEILTNEQVKNAQRAGADEIVRTNEQTSNLIINTLSSHGMSKSIESLLQEEDVSHIHLELINTEWETKSFEELQSHFLKERKIVIGIKRDEINLINPAPGLYLMNGDELILIS
ncbi:potassium channel family protein [Mangrovibacillus cuniculi]|uniref:Potassium channel protein n=1 Tax=Mangrovibacillus cuniculi TaxID=2593652 RepID=A0A7S8CC89_9BACI|nr:potassium channel family protein [Mangrovibacillus cuniculi]QPC47327.1 potassium channel protein [Mangrovibacillus cuniculi]